MTQRSMWTGAGVVTLMLLGLTNLFAQASKESMAAAIPIQSLRHPYLVFSDEEKPALRERIRTDHESRAIMNDLLAEGNRLLRMPFQKQILLEPEHPRFASGNEARAYVRRISDGAVTLSFLYQMTGEDKYVARAAEFAAAICDVPEWRYAAHSFDIIYPRVWPWNVPDDHVVFSFDLNTARMARILSLAYDWLYPALTPAQRDKIRGALLEKAITRVRGNYEFFWWSTAYRCNWSAICNAGLGMASLALLNEHPQLVDVTAESYNRISRTFDNIGDEGGWQEGRGYFEYMVESSAYFMDALKRATRGKWNLFQHPKIKANAADFLLYGLTAEFGDSHGEVTTSTFYLNKLVTETGSTATQYYRNRFLKEGTEPFDILWPRSSAKGEAPRQMSRLFKNIDWALLRSDFFDPSAVTIACKAGFNDDPHHGHLDCGQFSLTWHNVPFIRDLGRMEYDEFYFNEERYEYSIASSEGHNVLSVNGERQITAKKKNQPWKQNIGGHILDFASGKARDYVLMDPTRAYPGAELKKWRRSIVLEKPAVTLLLDEITTAPGAEIRARFFPGVGTRDQNNGEGKNGPERRRKDDGTFAVLDSFVYLSDGNNHNMAMIPLVAGSRFQITQDHVVQLPVMEEARPEHSQYVETVTKAAASSTVIATLFIPVTGREQAATVAASAQIMPLAGKGLEVTVATAEGTLRWRFDATGEGLVLHP